MNNQLSKRQIKTAIQEYISLQIKEKMLASKKVADRISEDFNKPNYLDRMGINLLKNNDQIQGQSNQRRKSQL